MTLVAEEDKGVPIVVMANSQREGKTALYVAAPPTDGVRPFFLQALGFDFYVASRLFGDPAWVLQRPSGLGDVAMWSRQGHPTALKKHEGFAQCAVDIPDSFTIGFEVKGVAWAALDLGSVVARE
jgi:hypothetical protein